MLALSNQLLDELDLERAAADETAWKPDLVPPPLVNDYAANHHDTVVKYVSEVGRASLDTASADVIAASKWQYGRRPVAFLPLTERIIYRAVVQVIRDQMPALNRSSEDYTRFQREPLATPGVTHVVTTDLSNFYSSIPTSRLATELVERTGRWEPVEWLKGFWLRAADGNNGIPQVSQPSDIIAETYADELHRRILRRNVKAWRWADDFHFAASSRSEAFTSIEIFDEEARKLGLVVNERKTQTLSVADFEARIEAPTRRLQEITREAAIDLTDFDPYENIIATPSDAEVQQAAAIAILYYWQRERVDLDRKFDIVGQMELASLLRHALTVLEVLSDGSALDQCAEILRLDPQLTPQVVKYLDTLAASKKREVQQATQKIVETVPLNRWQRLWLLSLYASDNIATTEMDEPTAAWIRSNIGDSSETVRSVAAWALARNWMLTSGEWNSLTGRSTRLGGPWLSASLHTALGFSSSQRTTLLSSDKLDRDLYRWVGEWDPFPAPF